MKISDIAVGAKYSNPAEKYGGTRFVDAIFKQRNGQLVIRWTNAEPTRTSSGYPHGVSTLATFARWARVREQMSEQEIQAHARRAAQHDEAVAMYGASVHAMMDRLDRLDRAQGQQQSGCVAIGQIGSSLPPPNPN